MNDRYWLILPNGGRQLIDPSRFDIDAVAEQARRIGGRLEVEPREEVLESRGDEPRPFEPPLSALGPMFRNRLDSIFLCECGYELDMNHRPTVRVLGGYYKRQRLVRIYTHDKITGRRPLEELFDTFLHEIAHHLEYTEPHSFNAKACGRVRGRMHSNLFWRILGELKRRWIHIQRPGASLFD